MFMFQNIIFRNINADECDTFVQYDTLSFNACHVDRYINIIRNCANLNMNLQFVEAFEKNRQKEKHYDYEITSKT